MQQRDPPRQVIEDEQRLWGHESGVGNVSLLLGIDRQLLEQAHDVVSGHAHEATSKRQLIVGARPWREFERLAQRVEVLLLRRRARVPLAGDRQRLAVHPDLEGLAETEEGIARQTLATLDRLEQEARLQCLEFQVSRYRSVKVGRDVKRCLHVFSIRRSRTSTCFAA